MQKRKYLTELLKYFGSATFNFVDWLEMSVRRLDLAEIDIEVGLFDIFAFSSNRFSQIFLKLYRNFLILGQKSLKKLKEDFLVQKPLKFKLKFEISIKSTQTMPKFAFSIFFRIIRRICRKQIPKTWEKCLFGLWKCENFTKLCWINKKNSSQLFNYTKNLTYSH